MVELTHEEEIERMRNQLLEKVSEVVGYEPPGFRQVLRVLTHPEVAPFSAKYIGALDKSSACTIYEPPWNCAKESEAKYENLKYGWIAGDNYTDHWCDNCEKRVMGE